MKHLFIIAFTFSFYCGYSQTYINYDLMEIYVKNGTDKKYFNSIGKGKTINDKKEGKWEEYLFDSFNYYKFEKGKVNGNRESLLTWGEGNYEGDKRTGLWELYLIDHPSRKKFLCMKANYKNGMRNGEAIYYYPSGEVAAKGVMKDNEIQGKLTQYYPTEEIYQEFSIENGSAEGPSKTFYKDGSIKREIIYCEGAACGLMTGYYPGGEIEYKNNYKEGYLDGHQTYYYPDGTLKEEANWKERKIDGNYKYYYPSGSVWVEKIFENGLVMEIVGLFDKSGAPLDYGTLKNGTGTVKSYTEDGVVYKIDKFKNGELKSSKKN